MTSPTILHHAAEALYELARWWLLDVCQVLLILAIISYADQRMGAAAAHPLTAVSRAAAIVYIGGSFAKSLRQFERARGWNGMVRVGSRRYSSTVAVSVLATIVAAVALTLYLDPIVVAFGAMLP